MAGVLQFGALQGGRDNGLAGPGNSAFVTDALVGPSTGMSNTERAHLMGGKPFNTIPSDPYLQGRTHNHIGDYQGIMQAMGPNIQEMLMAQIGDTATAFEDALPKRYVEGTTMAIHQTIFMNDAPAVRSAEAPNPQLTHRTQTRQVEILQHGVAIPMEAMFLDTKAGAQMFQAQLAQAAESFREYFVIIQADELLRPHKIISTSGSRVQPSDIFESEDDLIAFLQDTAADFNIWNEHTDGTSAVTRSISSKIAQQNGTFDTLIIPERVMRVMDTMLTNAMQRKSAAGGGVRAPTIRECGNIPQLGHNALQREAQVGQFATSEYSPLEARKRGIRIPNETQDDFTDLDLDDGLLNSGLFTLNQRYEVTGFTPMGRAFFRPYRTWAEYLTLYGVLDDFTGDANLERRLDAGFAALAGPGAVAAAAAEQKDAGGARGGIQAEPEDLEVPVAGYEEEYKKVIDALNDALGIAVRKDARPPDWVRVLTESLIKATLMSLRRSADGRRIRVPDDLPDMIVRAGELAYAEYDTDVDRVRAVGDLGLLDWNEFTDTAEREGRIRRARDVQYARFVPTTLREAIGAAPEAYPGFFADLVRLNGPVPVTILWMRPHMRFAVEATIGCQGGGGTGMSAYGPGKIDWGGSATTQVRELSVTTHFAALVLRPENLATIPCSRVVAYRRGGGGRVFNILRDKRYLVDNGNLGDADIIAAVMPPGWRPQRNVMDITGRWAPGIVRMGNPAPHYPNAGLIAQELNLRHASADEIRRGRVSTGNTVLWRMTQLPKTKDQADLGVDAHEGSGPLRGFYPGKALQRRGRAGPPVENRGGVKQTVTPYQQL